MHKYRGENPASSREETPDATGSKHRMRNSLAVIAMALAVGIVYLSIAGWQLRMPDAEQYAAIAARFLKTGQYQGVFTRGSEMATLSGPLDKHQPWPASYHRPGFPLILAAAFGIGGGSDVTYHVIDIAFFALLLCAEHDPDLYAQGNTLLPNFTKVAAFDKPSSVWHCRYNVYLRRDQPIATASSEAKESSP